MTCRIAERELLRSRRRRRRVSRSGLLGLLGLLIGLPLRLALLGGLLPSGIGGGGDLLLGGEGAEGDENHSGKNSGDRADHRETPGACAGRIPGAIWPYHRRIVAGPFGSLSAWTCSLCD